jgi:hypothetical protein
MLDKEQLKMSQKMAEDSDRILGIKVEGLSTLDVREIGTDEEVKEYTKTVESTSGNHATKSITYRGIGDDVTSRITCAYSIASPINIPYNIPDVFTMYTDDILKGIITDVLGKVNYYGMLTKNYTNLYTVIYNSLQTNDPTSLPLIESVFYGLLIPYKDIPLNMNHEYRYGDLLRKLFTSRLKRGV